LCLLFFCLCYLCVSVFLVWSYLRISSSVASACGSKSMSNVFIPFFSDKIYASAHAVDVLDTPPLKLLMLIIFPNFFSPSFHVIYNIFYVSYFLQCIIYWL